MVRLLCGPVVGVFDSAMYGVAPTTPVESSPVNHEDPLGTLLGACITCVPLMPRRAKQSCIAGARSGSAAQTHCPALSGSVSRSFSVKAQPRI